MAQIQVTVAEMEDKKAQLEQLRAQFEEEIASTDQIVANLKNEWEGDASDAFQESYKTKTQKLKQAAEGIKAYITVLGKIIQAYIETEGKNAQIASK